MLPKYTFFNIYILYIYIYIYTNIYILLVKVKLATLVKDDSMAPLFNSYYIEAQGVPYSIPWTALRYPWSLLYNKMLRRGAIHYNCLSLCHDLTWELNPGLLDHWRTFYSLLKIKWSRVRWFKIEFRRHIVNGNRWPYFPTYAIIRQRRWRCKDGGKLGR